MTLCNSHNTTQHFSQLPFFTSMLLISPLTYKKIYVVHYLCHCSIDISSITPRSFESTVSIWELGSVHFEVTRHFIRGLTICTWHSILYSSKKDKRRKRRLQQCLDKEYRILKADPAEQNPRDKELRISYL